MQGIHGGSGDSHSAACSPQHPKKLQLGLSCNLRLVSKLYLQHERPKLAIVFLPCEVPLRKTFVKKCFLCYEPFFLL